MTADESGSGSRRLRGRRPVTACRGRGTPAHGRTCHSGLTHSGKRRAGYAAELRAHRWLKEGGRAALCLAHVVCACGCGRARVRVRVRVFVYARERECSVTQCILY